MDPDTDLDPTFQLNPDPDMDPVTDLGFDDQNLKKIQVKSFFIIKNAIYLSLGLL